LRETISSAKKVKMDAPHPIAKTANAPVKLVKDNRTGGFFLFLSPPPFFLSSKQGLESGSYQFCHRDVRPISKRRAVL